MTKFLPFGPVMIDIAGPELSAYDKEKISHPSTGAVILFNRNYFDPAQIIELNKQIRESRPGPILIAVDQEGGKVQRFQQGFTPLPPAAYYQNKASDAKLAGWLMAVEILAAGCDFSFAPVLDVDCGISEIIGNRSFSQNPLQAAQLAASFTKGMHEAGMAAVGKHFPGHGAIALDSHIALPIDNRDLHTLRDSDLIPFSYLINNGLEGIMPAHVVYPKIDKHPAGFSSIWLGKILRQELAFDGAVFSDDLSMAGAACAGNFVERSLLAIRAGCDMILVCNNPEAADQVLDALPIKSAPLREKRLNRMRGKSVLSHTQLLNNRQWQHAANYFKNIKETW